MSAEAPSFDRFVESLQLLGGPVEVDPKEQATYEAAAMALQDLAAVDRASLSTLIHEHPEWARVLGLVVGLSKEQLKNKLRHRFKTASAERVARIHGDDLVGFLNEEYKLLDVLEAQRKKDWTFADILLERAASTSRAGRAIRRGKALEDAVETVVRQLGLPLKLRTRFIGRDGRSGPCDVAIPSDGENALIVIAVKGFDSTGSKQGDALREIREMATNRDARQFAFAVVDGIGWLGRQADLRKIYELVVARSIHGLYSLAWLEEFKHDLERAAHLHQLL